MQTIVSLILVLLPRSHSMINHSFDVKTQSTSSCCWCVNRWTEENEVSGKLGIKDCTKKNENPLFKSCRQVEVIGKSCSFVKISSGGDYCEVHNLFYVENGNKLQIPTPSFTVCMARALKSRESYSVDRVQSQAATAEKGKRKIGRDESVCSCAEDPINPKRCVASITDGRGADQSEYGSLGPGENSCGRECRRLFAESSTFANCDRFRH